jgi:Asp-tRNA(Asn)/Glu-tRNA(Gln) amidotransferase A subunit family amidase
MPLAQAPDAGVPAPVRKLLSVLQAPDLFGANSYVGPMGRTVGDVMLFNEVLAGPHRLDPYGQKEAGPVRTLVGLWP